MRSRVAVAAAVAGLVLATGGAGVARDDHGPRIVNVTLRHTHFHPATFTFPAGTTVRFVVHNEDPIDHEFLLGDAARQASHETGTERRHGAVPGEVSVDTGTSASTTYTFGSPGVVLLGCHAPGHYAYGMRGSVSVT